MACLYGQAARCCDVTVAGRGTHDNLEEDSACTAELMASGRQRTTAAHEGGIEEWVLGGHSTQRGLTWLLKLAYTFRRRPRLAPAVS